MTKLTQENKLAPTMSMAMGKINRYHEYLWNKVAPHIGSRVLEIGVGHGQYSKKILASGKILLGCDIDEGHIDHLKNSVASQNLKTQILDLCTPSENAVKSIMDFKPDTIIMLNVLEHIKEQENAVKFLYNAVPVGTKLIMILPAIQNLYNGLDREAGHFRRYNRQSLSTLLEQSGWNIRCNEYFNLPGVPGWLLAGILSRTSGKEQTELNAPSTNLLLKIYDRFFVHASVVSDPLIKKLLGLSILNVAEKTKA